MNRLDLLLHSFTLASCLDRERGAHPFDRSPGIDWSVALFYKGGASVVTPNDLIACGNPVRDAYQWGVS